MDFIDFSFLPSVVQRIYVAILYSAESTVGDEVFQSPRRAPRSIEAPEFGNAGFVPGKKAAISRAGMLPRLLGCSERSCFDFHLRFESFKNAIPPQGISRGGEAAHS
jgi:hypothetical protein